MSIFACAGRSPVPRCLAISASPTAAPTLPAPTISWSVGRSTSAIRSKWIPIIDLDATARVEDYDIDIGVHGPLSKLNLTYRSEPPLPEADIFALLALGRTQEEQQIYSQEQQAAGVNSTADALLGGALNATVSNRVSKLFGVGSVKIDPNYVGNLGNSTRAHHGGREGRQELDHHLCDEHQLHSRAAHCRTALSHPERLNRGATRRVGRLQRDLENPSASTLTACLDRAKVDGATQFGLVFGAANGSKC